MRSSGYFQTGCWIITIPIILVILWSLGGCLRLYSNDVAVSSIFLIFFILVSALIVAIVFWILGFCKAVKETIVYVVDSLIDLFTVKREIKQKCPEALKAVILEKSKHAVNVGIFDDNEKITEKIKISGEGVVADDLYKGMTISL